MGSFEVAKKRALVEPKNKYVSQRKQCELLGIERSGLYYKPRGSGEEELQLMRAIDEQYLKTPFFGRRRMALEMRDQGFFVGEKRVRTAMRVMGLEAIYPRPNLSRSDKQHKKYPYLLRDLVVDHSDQAWAADITYLPMDRGFGYLFAIIDWYSRYVLEWELSNLLDVDFCIEALERSLKEKHPKIFNTDQGVQFTSCCFTERLEKEEIQISMDGKGRALDNIFIERLWRSVKYENVYPKGYENLKEARIGLKNYFEFYNENRRHQGLGYRTPAEVYYEKQID